MSDDILTRATLALRDGVDREGGTAEDERNGRPTLTRVLRTVQRSRGRRRVMWIVGLQLAFGGVAVGAWAVRSGGLATLKRRFVADDVPARSAPVARIADRRPALQPPAADQSATTVTASPPVAPAVRPAAPAVRAPTAQRKQSPPDRRRVEVASAAAPPLPAALTAAELYERAHQAHFVRRDFGAALELWNRYLALGGAAPLVAEARFNRAIALLHLGRPAAAATDLRPFADGDYGAYRREEARTLLRRIAEQP
jgi:hypothetical protein